MLLAQNKSQKIEEVIIEILQAGGSPGPDLLVAVSKKMSVSKETFYRALRTLLTEEVLTKYDGVYQLNRHWLQKIYRFSKKHIEENIDLDDILSFKEGDKITYKFNNPNAMGIYWAHTYDSIFEHHDPKVPILVYHPHEWLIYTRTRSESFFLNRFADDKKLVLFAIGGNTSLDKDFKNTWAHAFRQIGVGIAYDKKRVEYVNVLGDFIFKVSMSEAFNTDIDVFFKTHDKVTPANIGELEKICSRKDTAKMTFIRSKKEAALWRTKFKKDFFVPKT